MLTEEMTRLCGEIVALRTHRGELLKTLGCETRDRSAAVADLCRQFHKARAGMARRMHHERASFLRNLRQGVNAQRREMSSDLAGVRRAWAGKAA
jgi:hypothetical protein